MLKPDLEGVLVEVELRLHKVIEVEVLVLEVHILVREGALDLPVELSVSELLPWE